MMGFCESQTSPPHWSLGCIHGQDHLQSSCFIQPLVQFWFGGNCNFCDHSPDRSSSVLIVNGLSVRTRHWSRLSMQTNCRLICFIPSSGELMRTSTQALSLKSGIHTSIYWLWNISPSDDQTNHLNLQSGQDSTIWGTALLNKKTDNVSEPSLRTAHPCPGFLLDH